MTFVVVCRCCATFFDIPRTWHGLERPNKRDATAPSRPRGSGSGASAETGLPPVLGAGSNDRRRHFGRSAWAASAGLLARPAHPNRSASAGFVDLAGRRSGDVAVVARVAVEAVGDRAQGLGDHEDDDLGITAGPGHPFGDGRYSSAATSLQRTPMGENQPATTSSRLASAGSSPPAAISFCTAAFHLLTKSACVGYSDATCVEVNGCV